MLTLAPGITQVATAKGFHAFLVAGDDGLTLVDTGMGRKAPARLLAALAEAGHRPRDVRRIVLTHAHPDHVQAVPEMRRATGARVLIHPADADWLPAGRVPPGRRAGALGGLVDRLPLAHWTPFEADALLTDGEVVEGSGGLRVVHTGGHTPGHVVLLHEPTRTALVGDALFHRGEHGLGPRALAAVPEARPAGVARIPAEVDAVGFSHGTAITGPGPGLDAFRAFVDGQG